jgi:hypothetical protein
MDPDRKHWNEQQQRLQKMLLRPAEHRHAVGLFLSQHTMVHSADLAKTETWTFDEEAWQAVTEEVARCIPPGFEHSIAWLTWHMARCEDITMNLLVAGSPQVLLQDGWLERIKTPVRDTANTMSLQEQAEFNAVVDIQALRAYRTAVGLRTRQVVQALQPGEMKKKTDPARLERVRAEGAVLEGAQAIIDYWGSRTIAGLLLMPATRHNLLHLNEAVRMKKKLR